jgi:hypothetical protein
MELPCTVSISPTTKFLLRDLKSVGSAEIGVFGDDDVVELEFVLEPDELGDEDEFEEALLILAMIVEVFADLLPNGGSDM